jgi:hypothetical protein
MATSADPIERREDRHSDSESRLLLFLLLRRDGGGNTCLLRGFCLGKSFDFEPTCILLTGLRDKHYQNRKGSTSEKVTDLKTEDKGKDYEIDDVAGRNKLESLNLVGVRVYVRDGLNDGAERGDNDREVGGNAKDEQRYERV